MVDYRAYNPFGRRESYGKNALLAYRILAPISWLLVVIVGIYYSAHRPYDKSHSHNIWKQANKHHTPFSESTIVTGIYWIVLLIAQGGYVWHFFSKDTAKVAAAAHVGTYFILNNLFIFAWILLWTRGYFWGSEIIIIANLINQGVAYHRHLTLPRLVHFAAIAGPYVWTFMMLFWNGAVAVGAHNQPARLVANIFIWAIFIWGHSHILIHGDYVLGYSLSFLTLALALKQLAIKVIALQWIFAFVIFGVLLVLSIYVSTGRYYQRDLLFRPVATPGDSGDRERQPLLDEQ